MITSILRAEWRRRWSVHPISTFFSTFIFPATMVLVIFYLPRADMSTLRLDLFTVAYSLSDLDGADPRVEALIEQVSAQPIYGVIPAADAQAAHERGEVAAAMHLSPSPVDGEIRVDLFHDHDLISNLLIDRLEVKSELEQVVFQAQDEAALEREEGKGHLARVGLFILLGFAWFFISSGVIEKVVLERERRTLEGILALPIPAKTLLRARLLEVVLHGAIPQVICGFTLLALGFSIHSLGLPLFIISLSFPLAFACFLLLYRTEELLAAGWKTGVLFMFAFPVLILLSDILGTLSPAYQLAQALDGQMVWSIFLGSVGGFFILSLLSWWACAWVAPKWKI